MNRPLNQIISDPERCANLEARFWPKVERRTRHECWPWIAKATHPFGYGRMTAGRGVNLKAHQIAFALANGPIPEGSAVLHSCDHPWCCNARHLFLGSQRDNMADALKKGRGSPPPMRFGEAHHKTKFDTAIAQRIAADARSAEIVAAEHGVSTKTVYRLRWGQTWKSLPE